MKEFVIKNGVLEQYTGAGGDVVIPEGVTEIGDNAFANCRELKSVIIPEGVTLIGVEAFNSCWELESVTFPRSLEQIGAAAFGGCEKLQGVTLHDGLYTIERSAFAFCWGITELVCPDTLEVIEDLAFHDCRNMKTLQLNANIQEIGDSAFAYCNSLEAVTIPAGTAVGANAFAFCKKLTTVTIGQWVGVDFGAFAGNPKLAELHIQRPVEFHGARIFQGCPLLADEKGFIIVEGTLYEYRGNEEVVMVPENVQYVDEGAFTNLPQLRKVIFPAGLNNFADGVFDGCKNMVDDQGFHIIRNVLFEYWGDAEEVFLPDCVTAICKNAFAYKDNLRHLHISERVIYIGEGAFNNCGGMIVHAPADSYAAQYAEENWIQWVAEDE